MFSLISSIFTGLTSLGQTYIEKKAEKAKAQHDRDVAQIKSTDNWETLQIQGGFNSWKDEFLTLIAVTPMIMVFFPDLRPYAVEGFRILSDKTLIPEWYLYLVSAVFAAGLGVKGMAGAIKTLKG